MLIDAECSNSPLPALTAAGMGRMRLQGGWHAELKARVVRP